MAKAIQINRDEQLAREYADRLILGKLAELQTVVKLSEIADQLGNYGIGLSEVRSLLASNESKFAYSERRWVPAARVEGAQRPFAEKIRLTVDRFGGPMPMNLLLNELSLLAPDSTESSIRAFISKSPEVGVSNNDLVFIRAWCFDGGDATIAKAYGRNRVTAEEVQEAIKKVGDVQWNDTGSVAKALEKLAPISVKVLGAAAWTAQNPEDPRSFHEFDWKSFYAAAFAAPGFVYRADGTLHPESAAKKWLSTAVLVADKLAPTVEVEDAAPIEVKADDLKKMVAKIKNSPTSVTSTKLLEEFYEITQSVKTFPDDQANLHAALKEDAGIIWVGGDRFNKAGVVPELVESVPEIFKFEMSDVKDEDGEYVDIELNDDGLSSTLRKLLNHPLSMDVLDYDDMPEPKVMPEQIRCVLKSIHREVGTFPMTQFPTGFISSNPQFQELVLIDQDGRELQVWANTTDKLLVGFIDWFYEQPVESGAVFSLTRTTKPNVFEFAWLDQTDPVVFITSQRMEELRDLQGRSEGVSTYDILREVMTHWPKGADFLTILCEVNVVRRSTRRLVASLLSSYSCFYQRSGSPVWHYDSKKVEAGFDKTKRKFVNKR